VFVQEGLPVTRTHDWVTLQFVPSIEVPEDAWIDWDPTAQRFITVREAHPQGLSARTRTVVRYVDDLYQRRWHDGTRVSLADLIMGLILTFDRAKEQSPLYDEAEVPSFETFVGHFRGARIIQEDPLVAEIYSDQILPDAELMSRAGFFSADVPWHKLAIGILAETNRELAFSKSKADRLRVEWMSYIAGPSLAVLERYRIQAQERGFVPYENVLGKYVTREEVTRRYEALGQWRRERGHFWVGNGPFYVHSVHPVEKNVVVRRAEGHLTTDERWLAFTRPRIAEIDVSGPSRTERGARAEFPIKVAVRGEPYPRKEVEFVKFLVFDARGRLAFTQEAEAVRDGEWRAILTPEQTGQLDVGSNRLEVVVVSRAVSIASSDSFTFVTR
jgi:peptide/nickel transport system substrate-binding protein